MNNLKFDMMVPGYNGHPQSVLKALGIRYEIAIPQSLYDQWWFIDCDSVPEPLPGYLSLLPDTVLNSPEVQYAIRQQQKKPPALGGAGRA